MTDFHLQPLSLKITSLSNVITSRGFSRMRKLPNEALLRDAWFNSPLPVSLQFPLKVPSQSYFGKFLYTPSPLILSYCTLCISQGSENQIHPIHRISVPRLTGEQLLPVCSHCLSPIQVYDQNDSLFISLFIKKKCPSYISSAPTPDHHHQWPHLIICEDPLSK